MWKGEEKVKVQIQHITSICHMALFVAIPSEIPLWIFGFVNCQANTCSLQQEQSSPLIFGHKGKEPLRNPYQSRKFCTCDLLSRWAIPNYLHYTEAGSLCGYVVCLLTHVVTFSFYSPSQAVVEFGGLCLSHYNFAALNWQGGFYPFFFPQKGQMNSFWNICTMLFHSCILPE